MEAWNYIEEVGNPKKAGVYHVVLIHPEYKNGKATGRMVASADTRLFDKAEEFPGWIMKDQPDTGLVWLEESGSFLDERVHAWMKLPAISTVKLPNGVVLDEETL